MIAATATATFAPQVTLAGGLKAIVGLRPGLIALLGKERGAYFNPRKMTVDQVIEGLGVPNDDQNLQEGMTLVSGCRPHSCDEKAAVVRSSDGVVEGAAMVHYNCRATRPNTPKHTTCASQPILTVVARKSNSRTDSKAIEALTNWGQKAVPGIRIDREALVGGALRPVKAN